MAIKKKKATKKKAPARAVRAAKPVRKSMGRAAKPGRGTRRNVRRKRR